MKRLLLSCLLLSVIAIGTGYSGIADDILPGADVQAVLIDEVDNGTELESGIVYKFAAVEAVPILVKNLAGLIVPVKVGAVAEAHGHIDYFEWFDPY